MQRCSGLAIRSSNRPEVANGSPRGGQLVAPRRRTGRPEAANWSPRGGELVAPRWRTGRPEVANWLPRDGELRVINVYFLELLKLLNY